MKWYSVTGRDLKYHCVPEPLLLHIIGSLDQRGVKELDYVPTTETNIADLHGSTAAVTLLLDDLVIRIPTESLPSFTDAFSRAEIRHEIGAPYLKLHHFQGCLCLTPNQWAILIELMLKQMRREYYEQEGETYRDH